MYNEGLKQVYIENKLQKQKTKKKKKKKKTQSKQTARNLFKLCSQVFPNSAPVAPILRGGPSLVGEEKKRKKEKHQDGSGGGKEEEREAKRGTSERKEEKAGILCLCISPDS